MYDIFRITKHQRRTDIFSDFYNHFLRNNSCILFDQCSQWGQQFHTDKNIPSNSIFMRFCFKIIATDNIGLPFKCQHDLILIYVSVKHIFILISYTDKIISICKISFNVFFIFWERNHLYSSIFHDTRRIPLCQIHTAITASSQPFYNLPSLPGQSWISLLIHLHLL